jgi:hypothetical protein
MELNKIERKNVLDDIMNMNSQNVVCPYVHSPQHGAFFDILITS